MSSSVRPHIVLKKSDGSISKGQIIKKGSDDDHVAAASAATDKTFGVAQNDAPNAEDPVEVAIPGGGAKFLAGGTIAAGDQLTSDASGHAIATTTTGDRVIGVAEVDAVASDVFAGFVTVSSL
jgi:hypothetical protein